MEIHFNNLIIGIKRKQKINFSLSDNDKLAIIGKNGIGKTTLLKEILGVNSTNFKLKNNMKYAAVFQENLLDNELSITDNLKVRSNSNQEYVYAINILKKLGFNNFNQKYESLSGGEKRILNFSRAIMLDPELLILDELSSGIDIQTLNKIWSIIDLKLSKSIKVIFTTHHLTELKHANKLLFIRNSDYLFFDDINKFLVNLPKYKLVIHNDLNYKNEPLFFNHFNEAYTFVKRNNIKLDNIEILNPTYDDLFNEYSNVESRKKNEY